jgi:hypothetical protein
MSPAVARHLLKFLPEGKKKAFLERHLQAVIVGSEQNLVDVNHLDYSHYTANTKTVLINGGGS